MSVIDELLRLQELDCGIRDLEQLKRDIPARKTEEQERLTEHKKALNEAEESLKAKLVAVKEMEVETQARKEKIGKFRSQQVDIKTNREFRALEEEIKNVEDQISGIEDRELVLMEEVEALRKNVDEKRRALEEEDRSVHRDCAAWDEKIRQTDARLAEETAKRQALVAAVDPAWIPTYEAIFERKDRALVPVEGEVCGGCHMKLPRYIVHASRKRTEMVKCDFCGRLVY